MRLTPPRASGAFLRFCDREISGAAPKNQLFIKYGIFTAKTREIYTLLLLFFSFCGESLKL